MTRPPYKPRSGKQPPPVSPFDTKIRRQAATAPVSAALARISTTVRKKQKP